MFDKTGTEYVISTKLLQEVYSMKKLDVLAATLVLVGGLNWGLVAVARFDLVAFIFGGMDFGETNAGSRIVYGLVGLAAVYGLTSLLGAGRRSSVRTATVGAR
jgi:uncharacterized membrane protein YuzA (DUF378 family)